MFPAREVSAMAALAFTAQDAHWVNIMPRKHTAADRFHKRVLIIEDDGWIRRFMRDMLTDEGYEVIEAADGRTGIRLVADYAPGVVLLDVAMPDLPAVDA